MKLVAAQKQASRKEGISGGDSDLAIAKRAPAGCHARPKRKDANHGVSDRGVIQRFTQVHEPATLGIDWVPCLGKPANILAHGYVRGQRLSMEFGIAAANPQGV